MSCESEKKGVQFRAPTGLANQADILAAVFETDRTDILITGLCVDRDRLPRSERRDVGAPCRQRVGWIWVAVS